MQGASTGNSSRGFALLGYAKVGKRAQEWLVPQRPAPHVRRLVCRARRTPPKALLTRASVQGARRLPKWRVPAAAPLAASVGGRRFAPPPSARVLAEAQESAQRRPVAQQGQNRPPGAGLRRDRSRARSWPRATALQSAHRAA